MGSLTDFAELKLLDHLFGNAAYTPPATTYLAFFTGDPTESGTLTSEPAGFGYARPAINFLAAASRKVVQDGQVDFPQITGGTWGTVTHFGVMNALTNGEMLAHGALDSPIVTVEDNIPFIPDAQLEIEISTGAASTYLAHKLLDLMFNNVSYTAPSIFVTMCSAAITDASTGATISEPAGNYARVAVNTWSDAANGALENEGQISFPTPSVNWPTITHSALLDIITLGSGNVLVYGAATPNQAPLVGDPVNYPAGAYDVSLN